MKINVLGDAFCDVVAQGLAKLPSWGGDSKSKGVGLFAGGSALNTAVHLKSLLHEEDKVTLFTAFGESESDWATLLLSSHLERHNVDIVAKRIPGETTGVCIVLSATTDRAFVTCNGAISHIAVAHIDVARLADADHIHFGGLYALSAFTDDFPTLLKKIRELNESITISVDTNFDASDNWGRPWLGEALPLLDIIHLNEMEAEGVYSRNRSESESDFAPVSWMASKVRHAAIVSHGESGATFACRVEPAKQYSIESVSVQAIDAVGAGDAFNAGFIARWKLSTLKNNECSAVEALTQAVTYGCLCGALNVTTVGACDVPVTHERVEALISIAQGAKRLRPST